MTYSSPSDYYTPNYTTTEADVPFHLNKFTYSILGGWAMAWHHHEPTIDGPNEFA